jgi:hypothetical protein
VVLDRERRTKERHDSIAGELIDRPFEAVHPLVEDAEEAIEDLVPLLRIELSRQLERMPDVDEQDGHPPALALDLRAALQDLGHQMGRRAVGQQWRIEETGRAALNFPAAADAEPGLARNLAAALGAPLGERGATRFAEGGLGRVRMEAATAEQHGSPRKGVDWHSRPGTQPPAPPFFGGAHGHTWIAPITRRRLERTALRLLMTDPTRLARRGSRNMLGSLLGVASPFMRL